MSLKGLAIGSIIGGFFWIVAGIWAPTTYYTDTRVPFVLVGILLLIVGMVAYVVEDA